MIRRMLKRDFSQNKMIITILFMFIMLSSLLMASASNNVVNLWNSMDQLFKVSSAPHFVQMHAGEVNQKSIDSFVEKTPFVKKQQTAEMVQINGSNIFIKKKNQAEHNSVMDISFVKQNSKFDFLLNLNNEVVDVRKGEIGVPIYYMQKYNLRIGDKIWVDKNKNELEFTISAFVRDVQMNPSIVSSKRFVISDEDFESIKQNFEEREYLIEFQLTDLNKINEFEDLYQSSNLPQKGPSITYSLFKTLNSLTDGIIAVFMIVVPVNFLYTIQSPKFVNYMGTGKSDIRIDLQQTDNIEKHSNDVTSYLRNDEEVEKYAAFVTSTFKMVDADGTNENLNLEGYK